MVVSHIENLPPEMLWKIFSNLDTKDLSACRKVNRIWYHICDHLLKVSVIKDITFGKKEWDHYFGVVEEAPPLPKNLHEIVEEVYRGIGKGEKIKETFMLQLIPKTVNGKPYCMNHLFEFHHKEEKIYNKEIKEMFGKNPVKKSYWVLFSKEILKDTLGKGREKQIALVKKIESCRAPKLIEAATCIFSYYAKTGVQLYNCRFACCKEMMESWVTYCGYSADKLCVSYYFGTKYVGAAVLRKLKSLES